MSFIRNRAAKCKVRAMRLALYWLHGVSAVALCAFAATGASAETSVRTISSAGQAQLRSVPAGQDGLQTPEFAPTFSNAPNLQDGPDAAGASGAAANSAVSSASLKQARKRMVNRSIARGRGIGEWISGDEWHHGGPRLAASFDGLDLRDQRLANGGNQFTVEPPDQGLCVGNGFVVESVNDVIRVFDRKGNPLTIKLTGKVEPYEKP